MREGLESFRPALNTLARATGLWNYIDKENADIQDLLLAEAISLPELGGITLHREQVSALNTLFSGKNLILSAPTSFGKSLLVDALLASKRYTRIAIILPTIALLDEFRRRLRRRFNDDFQVVMHPNDRATNDPTIFLGTQERMINRTDLGALDLTVVDEFYKLDPNRQDERNVTLNAAVYKLINKSNQFFFLGPNIDKVQVTSGGRWQFEFLRTRFATVAVDTYDMRTVKNKEEKLLEEISNKDNWPALVFVSSPDKANRLAAVAAERVALSQSIKEFSMWLRSNFGSGWPLINTVENGFALHHGRIPRAVASQMVRMFNGGDLPVLFCTSTLIEGVNTAAKTVLIFDKAINRAKYDFFTFSNIKGRAGRLGQHHVGRVYLFNEPPEPEFMEVAPTLFSEEGEAPDDYVVHLDDADINREMDDRLATLRQNLNLDKEGLRLASSVGLDVALALKHLIDTSIRNNRGIIWSGYPNYDNIRDTIDLICKVKKASEFGAVSVSQLTYFINNLRQNQTMKNFFLNYDLNFKGDVRHYENIFKFLRACEYGLPQLFAIVETFIQARGEAADYNLFMHDLSRWFRPEELKNLDEEGIPIQISERFFQAGDDRIALVNRLKQAVATSASTLSNFERRWVTAALDL